jgi:hypothetical protein
MPEPQGDKLTRAQESARYAYRRALEKAVRSVSKGTGWRSTQGCLFRDQSGWFLAVCPAVFIDRHRTTVLVTAKPMGIDPIFWDIVGLPENGELPLSFRLNGAWTCGPPAFAEVEVDECGDVDETANRILKTADQQIDGIRSWGIEGFLQSCEENGADAYSYVAPRICALIAIGHLPEAVQICESAQKAGSTGGFTAPEGSFTEMAIRWLNRSLNSSTRH